MGDGKSPLFHEYLLEWIEAYKQGAVRGITYGKYMATHGWLVKIAPDLRLDELDRRGYQAIINEYAKTHEKQTVKDFNSHLKAALHDAVDEGLIKKDPARKVVIKGKPPGNEKKPKFLSQFELNALLGALKLSKEADWDSFIYLLAKTGLRFSEALALTPDSFDFASRTLKVRNAWNYKSPKGGFVETKNPSSRRNIPMDRPTCELFARICRRLPAGEPIFAKGRVYNSTVNGRLAGLCKQAGIAVISLHGIRHTHASVLLYAGVSIASVARRLGHANTTTTQEVYLHIIKELENLDNERIVRHLSKLDK